VQIAESHYAAAQYSVDHQVNMLTGKSLENTSITTNSTSQHASQRASERNISQTDINDALKNPLKITDIKIQENGPSVKYIGTKVTVVVKPETRKIVTVFPTSTQRVKSILNMKK